MPAIHGHPSGLLRRGRFTDAVVLGAEELDAPLQQGLRYQEEKTHVGLDAMPEDAEDNYFQGDVSVPVAVTVDGPPRGSYKVAGELKYFYCVKKSGFCAPATQEVRVSLPLAAR